MVDIIGHIAAVPLEALTGRLTVVLGIGEPLPAAAR
jgi:hypothetical protein